MMQDAKVMVYIDGSNLYHSLDHICGRHDVDFSKFAEKLVAGRRLIRMYYYNAQIDQVKEPTMYSGQQRFFAALSRVPYLELRVGRLVYPDNWPTGPSYEKGVDIKIATDMLTHGSQDNYDVAILVSGDSDFQDALQAVKNLGHHVEVALFGRRTSQNLRDVADRVIELDAAFFSDCWQT
ncbi:MAG: NYN domain-containing protein [Dehalococcoidia bacterium]